MRPPRPSRHDAKGRTRSRSGRGKGLETPFVAHSLALLESPAWLSLSITARRVVDALEREHLHHGGRNNGQLVMTYAQLVRQGASRSKIKAALDELEDAGLVKVRMTGGIGLGERRPSRYELTYLPVAGRAPSHDWRGMTQSQLDAARRDRKDAALRRRARRAHPDPI